LPQRALFPAEKNIARDTRALREHHAVQGIFAITCPE